MNGTWYLQWGQGDQTMRGPWKTPPGGPGGPWGSPPGESIESGRPSPDEPGGPGDLHQEIQGPPHGNQGSPLEKPWKPPGGPIKPLPGSIESLKSGPWDLLHSSDALGSSPWTT